MALPEGLDVLFEAFHRNGRVNHAILDTLDPSHLSASDGTGGYSVGQHLADIVSFRRDKLLAVSPDHADGVPDVTDGDAATWLATDRIDELQAAFDAGDAAVEEAVRSAVADGRRFAGSYAWHPADLVVHTIVHDSHHRGQILALLRQHGRSAEDRSRLEDATWSIWKE